MDGMSLKSSVKLEIWTFTVLWQLHPLMKIIDTIESLIIESLLNWPFGETALTSKVNDELLILKLGLIFIGIFTNCNDKTVISRDNTDTWEHSDIATANSNGGKAKKPLNNSLVRLSKTLCLEVNPNWVHFKCC